ncbi:MAG: septum formation protein Maf [Oscillospiraceae bacterium]|nr:septum formation protein Maf [Oscillospiraceae bacterium]
MDMKFILASASPRRRELLKAIVPDFECSVPDFDESTVKITDAKQRTLVLSREKCRTVAAGYADKNAVVIASDTVVDLNGKILEKPKDTADAYNMIKSLSDNTHMVHTAVSVCCRGIIYSFVDTTKVYVDYIDDETIKRYVLTDEPYDKAGGYAIQGFMSGYISKIHGNYHTVVGLPVAKLNKLLKIIKAI